MVKTPYLSVIIPSYNEQQNIARGVLDEVIEYLKAQSYSWELILSDDGSTDGTIDYLQAFAQKHRHVIFLNNHHAGKGPTVQQGMLKANGQWRIFTDFDQSTPLGEIEKLLDYAQSGVDVVIGSREIEGAIRDDEPWYRHLMGRVFNFMVRMLAIPGIKDTQCGFKLFSAVSAEKLFKNLWIYGQNRVLKDAFTGAFDVEVLYLARKYGFQVVELPVIWHHHETNRVSPIKDSLRMLQDIIRVRFADLQHRYPSQ